MCHGFYYDFVESHPKQTVTQFSGEQFLYYQVEKRELKRRPTYEYRCDERLKAKAEGSTRLAYTGLREGLEHLKRKTRLINERFAIVLGVCVI